MSPFTFIVLTFGAWTLVKGRLSTYWGLATTKSAGATAPTTSNPSVVGAGVGSTLGTALGTALGSPGASTNSSINGINAAGNAVSGLTSTLGAP